MMQNFKKVTKVMAICALLVLSSCEKDLYDEAIQKDKNLLVKNISLSELSRKDNAKLFLSVDEVRNKKKNAQGKIVYDSINEIYFDDQSGKYIERADGYKSYTFPILKSGNGDKKIENIVFSLNEVGGYDVFKAKYDFTKEEMANFSEQQMTSHNVTYTEINQGKIGQIVCIETVSWQSFPIDSGDLTGNFGWTGAWVATSYHCYNMAENTGGFAGGGGDTDGPIGAPSTSSPTNGQSGAGSITTIAIPLTPTQEGMAAFMSHLSDPQLDWYHVQDEATLDAITNYLVQNSFSSDSINFAYEFISQMISSSSQETKDLLNELLQILVNNDDPNADSNDDGTTAPPDCASFNFTSAGSNWQYAAVANIHFTVVVLDPHGSYVNHVIEFPQPILFGSPKNLVVGSTTITPGMAATASANAVKISMVETKNKYKLKNVSELIVRMYFESRLKHNYPLCLPGGRVNIHPNASTVMPPSTQYQTTAFGTGDCN